MSKKKFVFCIISLVAIYFILDIILIFNINRPFVVIDSSSDNYIYKSIFYDVYNCPEYSVPQIKLKWTKYYCSIDKNNEDTTYQFTRTYNVLDVVDRGEYNYLYLTIKQFQSEEVETVKIEKNLAKGVVKDKYYEFTFSYSNKEMEDSIKSIFELCNLLTIKEIEKEGLEQVQEPIK